MTWTVDEHNEELVMLYRHNDVRNGLGILGIDVLLPGFFDLYEQVIVEDHPNYAWVWE